MSQNPRAILCLSVVKSTKEQERLGSVKAGAERMGCFPGVSDGKASTCNAGDTGLIPGLGRSHGEGNGNPLQHSCLENPMDGEG